MENRTALLARGRAGFLAAGATNVLGITLFTQGFTSPTFATPFPDLFGFLGQIGVVLWGLAYLSVAGSWLQVPWISAVFAVEKAFYVVTWLHWLVHHHGELPAIWKQSALTGFFYSAYGLIDLAFGLFFLWAFISAARAEKDSRTPPPRSPPP